MSTVPNQSSICDRKTSCELTPQLPRRGSYHFRVSKTFITNNSREVIQRISDSPGMRMLWHYFLRYSYQNASGEIFHSFLAFIFLVIPLLLLYQQLLNLKIMDSYLPLISRQNSLPTHIEPAQAEQLISEEERVD